ncbi:MAG: hypothetical protein IPM59_05795 [Chloracidobacterium sp.]|nr:hypothetical protein [Chloracidobacterium sp.]
MNKIYTLAFAAAIMLFVAGATLAQTCPGSYVTYLIRDKNGKPVDAASSKVTLAAGASGASKRWKVSLKEWAPSGSIVLPDVIKPLNGTISGLTTSQFCNFPEPATLSVTIGRKTMHLTFNFPPMDEYDSADFVVDSPKFKAGKYAITLAMPTGRRGDYYAATGWKRVR